MAGDRLLNFISDMSLSKKFSIRNSATSEAMVKRGVLRERVISDCSNIKDLGDGHFEDRGPF